MSPIEDRIKKIGRDDRVPSYNSSRNMWGTCPTLQSPVRTFISQSSSEIVKCSYANTYWNLSIFIERNTFMKFVSKQIDEICFKTILWNSFQNNNEICFKRKLWNSTVSFHRRESRVDFVRYHVLDDFMSLGRALPWTLSPFQTLSQSRPFSSTISCNQPISEWRMAYFIYGR